MLALTPAKSLADTAGTLFDDARIHEVRLTLDPAAWTNLQRDYLLNTYYPANISLEGQDLGTVGIRSRGTGSRAAEKPNLLVVFDRYEKNKDFLGLSAVVLKANNQDGSLVRELLAMKLMRAMGIPSPREALARLYVNDEYRGVYTLVERVNSNFLERHFGEKKGNLYEWDANRNPQGYHFEYLGPDPGLYCPTLWNPANNESSPEAELLVEFVDFINNSSAAAFRDRIREYVDVSAFLNFIATDNFLSDYDGLLGSVFGMNNFYFYRFHGTKRSTFIPWDKDGSFDWEQKPILEGVPENVLARRLLDVPEWRQQYLNALVHAAAMAGGNDGWLRQELERLYGLVRESATSDIHKQCTVGGVTSACGPAEFEAGIDHLRQFVSQRADFVIAEVRKLQGCSR
jgi:spore coat protein CotH